MAIEDDYILRMIRDIARILARIILGKDDINYELPREQEYTSADHLYKALLSMADEGRINEAENLLLEKIDGADAREFEMAASFYLYLNDFTDDFLEAHQYSREEIDEGIKHLGERFGVDLGGVKRWI